MEAQILVENMLNFKTRENTEICKDIGTNISTIQSKNPQLQSFESFKTIHPTTHDDMQIINYKCEECKYTSRYRSAVIDHTNETHLKTKIFVCDQCSFSNTIKNNLRVHILEAHNKITKYKCEYNFTQQRNLNKPINTVQRKCQLCEYTSKNVYRLGIHIREVHMKIKRYMCTQCEYASARKADLKKHLIAVHSKITNYSCSRPSALSRKTNIKLQQNTVQCNIENENVVHHKKQDENAVQPKIDILEYTCRYKCGYVSNNQGDLKKHTNAVHLTCKHCGFTSKRGFKVRRHIREVHLKIKNFGCGMCHFACSRKPDLIKHINAVHLKEELSLKPLPNCIQL